MDTIEFDCKHRFCSECTIEQFKGLIEKAEIKKLKCFNYECKEPEIKNEKIEAILNARDLGELCEKFKRFRDQKGLDSDPLVRWCPKPGCEEHMRAVNSQAEKMVCGKCATEVCFKCRDVWHGTESCEDAMKKQLQGWAEENKDNVSFCPMCRTRIEKSAGCNHMTCGFCEYEFCWACGQSASNADNHYGLLRGCGVKMMDDKAKPGDGRKTSKCCEVTKFILRIVLCPIWWPLWVVLYCPIAVASGCAIGCHKQLGIIGAIVGAIVGLIFGLGFNVCWIPLALIFTVVIGLLFVVAGCKWIGDGCKCTGHTESEDVNRKKAEENIKKKMGADDVSKV